MFWISPLHKFDVSDRIEWNIHIQVSSKLIYPHELYKMAMLGLCIMVLGNILWYPCIYSQPAISLQINYNPYDNDD